MTPERWQLISRIYHDALAEADADRAGFIRRASGGDQELEREVAALIDHSPSDSFLNGVSHRMVPLDAVDETRHGRLGRFELRGLLGVGGMGEVYRAHDPSLGRDVAVKILPREFTDDLDRLARFEREARVLASLSHPNIAAIHGVEDVPSDDGGVNRPMRALVLELVEGETLAVRLNRGPLGIEEALEIARQVADALEAAHAKGIIHRDLKPANIKIRPEGLVKVLDFGLATIDSTAIAGDAKTIDAPGAGATAAGIVLGTPAYMSPEQARGMTVDKRADVWAFGCVLYEMLAGCAPFAGDTPADVIAAVMHRDPDWSLLPATVPDAGRRVLRRCLEKKLTRRLRDVGDAWLDLETQSDPPAALPRRSDFTQISSRFAMTAALLLAGVGVGVWLHPPSDPQAVQFVLEPPDGQTLGGLMHPSPDGQHLLFSATSAIGETALWLRPLGSPTARQLPGTEDAVDPFWSADGTWIGFSANGMLRRVSVEGGPTQRITNLDPVAMGATVNAGNVVVFTPSNRTPLFRVAASGDERRPLTTLVQERRENSHRWPQFLPDGRHVLYTARSDSPEYTGIYVASIDDPSSARRLLGASSMARYVSSGYLLFTQDSTLFAQPFDARALALHGEPIALAGELAVEAAAANGAFAVSTDGSVVTYNSAGTQRLAWFDRSGMEVGAVAVRGKFSQLALSPDGTRAAVMLPDPQDGNRDVWVIALATGALTRLTSDPASDWFPVWSPDGSEVLFASSRDATPAFYRTRVGGGGADQLVFRAGSPQAVFPTHWSQARGALLFHSYPRGDVHLLPLARGAPPVALIDTPFTDWTATLSPDGRWVAYASDETGDQEIYVQEIDGARRHRLSTGGGVQPRWHDARELFYLSTSGKLWSVAFEPDTGPTIGSGRPLYDACPKASNPSPFMYRYDVTVDGSRALWLCDGDLRPTATIVLNSERLR